eukprot:3186135-Lingulodinium_polyedra.AAC.1
MRRPSAGQIGTRGSVAACRAPRRCSSRRSCFSTTPGRHGRPRLAGGPPRERDLLIAGQCSTTRLGPL